MKVLVAILFAFLAIQLKADDDWENIHPIRNKLPIDEGDESLASPDPFITGGVEAKPHQFPHQVGLILTLPTGKAFCGGSIICSRWILTAAHCVQKALSVEVIMGAQYVKQNETCQVRMISTEMIIHEKYIAFLALNDIGLVKLPKRVKFNKFIKPIRLPAWSARGNDFLNTTVTVSGWGKDADSATSISPVLRCVNMIVISNVVCRRTYWFSVFDSTICTTAAVGKSSCNGDSGGPLSMYESDGKPTLVGVVSFGNAKGCEKGYPAGFARVTNLMEWVQNKTQVPLRL